MRANGKAKERAAPCIVGGGARERDERGEVERKERTWSSNRVKFAACRGWFIAEVDLDKLDRARAAGFGMQGLVAGWTGAAAVAGAEATPSYIWSLRTTPRLRISAGAGRFGDQN